MKTAMQELIDELEVSFYDHKKGHYIAQMIVISTIMNKAKNKLEKEKEQIIQAHNKGQSDYNPSLESIKFESEQYYNQTYNQNK